MILYRLSVLAGYSLFRPQYDIILLVLNGMVMKKCLSCNKNNSYKIILIILYNNWLLACLSSLSTPAFYLIPIVWFIEYPILLSRRSIPISYPVFLFVTLFFSIIFVYILSVYHFKTRWSYEVCSGIYTCIWWSWACYFVAYLILKHILESNRGVLFEWFDTVDVLRILPICFVICYSSSFFYTYISFLGGHFNHHKR